ncbi:MAG TPA: SpoIIE family protein phosphatase [Actinomycetota bacterium]|nr:SpoIIE family protein phosphatase [Actinomycetota bacterium]
MALPVTAPEGRARILLVDDRPDNLLALEAVLEPLGLGLTTATSGEEALRLLLGEEFSLIILDVQMPGLDGFATARLIKLREKTRHIPIIFLTAISGAEEHHLEGFASGAIDYVYKPFEPSILRAKVAAVLEFMEVRRRLEQEVAERRASESRLAERERQLGESEERYRSLVEYAAEAIVVLDLDTGRFVDANPEAERLLAVSRASLVAGGAAGGRARGAPVAPDAWLERARRGGTEAFEWTLDGPDGEPVLCEVRFHPLPSAGRHLARGTVIDITQLRRAQEAQAAIREHERALRQTRQVAETLQRSLLPDRLPEIPGIGLAARYMPGSAGLEVGGDWYDVLRMSSGAIGLAVGDVVGRGLRAAATMGQLRTALRAYAMDDSSPARVVERLSALAPSLPEAEMATLVYAIYRPEAGMVTYMCAGHPAPLLVAPDGTARFLEEGRITPLGLPTPAVAEGVAPVEPGSLLVFYTDGLIERREVSLEERLEMLARAAGGVAGAGAEMACETILAAMTADAPARDDLALLVVSCAVGLSRTFRLSVAASPAELATVRQSLGRWLAHAGASNDERRDVVLAVSEAVTNAIVHAYAPHEGLVDIEASLDDAQAVTVLVRDRGTWRFRQSPGGGRGLLLMQALVDQCDLEPGLEGTEVRLLRRLGQPLRSSAPAEWPEALPEPPASVGGDEPVVVVHLAEDLDAASAEQTAGALARAVGKEHGGLVVDLSGVGFVDSSGVRVLVELWRAMRRRRQELRLVVPPGSPGRRVVELTRLASVIPLATSVPLAVAEIEGLLAGRGAGA